MKSQQSTIKNLLSEIYNQKSKSKIKNLQSKIYNQKSQIKSY